MNKFLRGVLIFLIFVAVGLFLYNYFVENIFDRRLSPKDTVEYKLNDLKLTVFYNRPYKRDRLIFGGLVPYGEVWRTGANEATTFSTNKNLIIKNYELPAGEYTLWTVPTDSTWQVIFNTKQYPWGVDEHMNPMREPEFDYLNVTVPSEQIDTEVEQFTIGFNNTTGNIKMTMAWETTKIEVPLDVLKDPLLD
ncbi:DUF2911 domain-containing protein [Aegicerativicinus sediminis]|uniref:DUF2911 domain-containing protein n=1 Tax=Aegicerativicinus sediminis TaxID=2893202 RepID=UPI001E5A532D|nr:DUF2911 domain-containing protein [Aegicerativicinus sediminis]